MKERACFVCSLDYKLPMRKPHILEYCIKYVSSECLEKIIEEKKLSKDIETNFTKFIFCDIHKDQRIESFCKYCEKAVCEECIVESHTCTECQSNICTI